MLPENSKFNFSNFVCAPSYQIARCRNVYVQFSKLWFLRILGEKKEMFKHCSIYCHNLRLELVMLSFRIDDRQWMSAVFLVVEMIKYHVILFVKWRSSFHSTVEHLPSLITSMFPSKSFSARMFLHADSSRCISIYVSSFYAESKSISNVPFSAALSWR